MGHRSIIITRFEMCLKFSQLINQKNSNSFKQWNIKHCLYILHFLNPKLYLIDQILFSVTYVQSQNIPDDITKVF